MERVKTVAVIGSFRQFYQPICDAWRQFSELGIEVTSPKGAPIVEEGIPFVRFESDPHKWDDPMVQTVALHRILRADFVFVVAPDGYVGRTTCYEIGRIIQASRPLYFSEVPKDLPIHVPSENIRTTSEVVELIRANQFEPTALFATPQNQQHRLELDLVNGVYKHDHEFRE
jgi:hypothetical protein